jgi:hypothetical protein
VGDFGLENPGLVLVTILPLCKKKLGFDSYEKCTLSLGGVDVAVTGLFSGDVVIVAVRQTDPYAAQERER